MARPRTGKVSVSQARIKQKNGDIYIYDRHLAYDPETRKTYTTKKVLVGKIPAGTNEMVPTRPKKSSREERPDVSAPVVAESKQVGASEILKWAGQASGITQSLHECFSPGDAQKIDTIAQYWVATDGRTLPHMERWQLTHATPYCEGMSEDTCSRLFADLGMNESGIQKYFLLRSQAEVGQDRLVIALDTTTVDTYSLNQIEARHGHSKEGKALPTIKLLTLLSIHSQQPIAFAKQPGNIPDVKSICNALKEVSCLGIKHPLIITDRGFTSEDNILLFMRKNISFLSSIKCSTNFVKEKIEKCTDDITNMEYAYPYDNYTFGKSFTIVHKFKILRERTRGKYKSGEIQTVNKRIYLHIFYSDFRASEMRKQFREDINELKKLIESGEELTSEAKFKKDKFLFVEISENNSINVKFNNEAINKQLKHLGFFALVSNSEKDTFKALKYYHMREKIEEMYSVQKGSVDGRRPRVWYPVNLRGRLFVQFIAISYYYFLKKSIFDMNERLGMQEEGKTSQKIKEEKQLKKWLGQRSLVQILEWFDAIFETRIKTPFARARITTESTARDELFLQELGVLGQGNSRVTASNE